MKIEQIYTGCLAQGAYIIESNGEVAIIDPLREVQQYIDWAEKHNATIKYILETHFHADFVVLLHHFLFCSLGLYGLIPPHNFFTHLLEAGGHSLPSLLQCGIESFHPFFWECRNYHPSKWVRFGQLQRRGAEYGVNQYSPLRRY